MWKETALATISILLRLPRMWMLSEWAKNSGQDFFFFAAGIKLKFGISCERKLYRESTNRVKAAQEVILSHTMAETVHFAKYKSNDLWT